MPGAARRLAAAIRQRHGPAVRALLFYGSCLRRESAEGVLDFYALVDRARDVYGLRPAAALAAALPPNVHYLEAPGEADDERLRTKYAVVTLRDFERLCSPRARHPYVWARFAQPARLVFASDDDVRARVTAACAEAPVTFVRRLAPLAAERVVASDFWRTGFARTYDTELRSESAARIGELYDADPERYDALLVDALGTLAREGTCESVLREDGTLRVVVSPRRRRRARLRWAAGRPLAKGLALLRLLKTPVTFQGWAPYVLWKLERHTGRRFEVSERQLRHPWIFGWPLLLRLLARRDLR